ncbi:hypothetical protein QU39_00025, partial [Staphylococcus aureus]
DRRRDHESAGDGRALARRRLCHELHPQIWRTGQRGGVRRCLASRSGDADEQSQDGEGDGERCLGTKCAGRDDLDRAGARDFARTENPGDLRADQNNRRCISAADDCWIDEGVRFAQHDSRAGGQAAH